MFKKILNFMWELPQNLIGIIFWVYLYKGKTKYQEVNGVHIMYSNRMQGGISLGQFVFITSKWESNITTRNHEIGHCIQSRMLGWFYLLIIGLPSILNAWLNISENYYDFYTEKWADDLMGITRQK